MNRHDLERVAKFFYGNQDSNSWGWQAELAHDLGVSDWWVSDRATGCARITYHDNEMLMDAFNRRALVAASENGNPRPWLRLVCGLCAMVRETATWRILLLPTCCGQEMLIAGWPKLHRMTNIWIDPVDNIIPRPKRLGSMAA